jgi:hypothetical protein
MLPRKSGSGSSSTRGQSAGVTCSTLIAVVPLHVRSRLPGTHMLPASLSHPGARMDLDTRSWTAVCTSERAAQGGAHNKHTRVKRQNAPTHTRVTYKAGKRSWPYEPLTNAPGPTNLSRGQRYPMPCTDEQRSPMHPFCHPSATRLHSPTVSLLHSALPCPAAG